MAAVLTSVCQRGDLLGEGDEGDGALDALAIGAGGEQVGDAGLHEDDAPFFAGCAGVHTSFMLLTDQVCVWICLVESPPQFPH